MQITGVRITHDGDVKDYARGRAFEFDGYGDLIIRDSSGAAVATRRRGTWDEIELTDDGS